MNAQTLLEWFHNGAWHEIGWRASNPRSVADLRDHGARLAAAGGFYRLVHPSIYADGPPTVIHEFPVVVPA